MEQLDGVVTPTGSTAFAEAARRVDGGADVGDEAALLVAALDLDEKLACLDGDTDFWSGLADMTGGGYHDHPWPAARVERLGIPGIEFVDGPRGSVVGPATCFPVSMARGATFDPGLEERIGEAMGLEMRSVGATYTGAVCMNLLRHPGWGRAQETYGEDPHHVGAMAAALTRGLQRHVMACMKHFALNSMENARFTVDVRVDERALHEVYLPHFRKVAGEGVASVMSAYNAVNGEWCGENRTLLRTILREEWGWDGLVITDFIFGLRDPVGSVTAGCDIEMPFRQQRAHALGGALADGRLTEADVDRAVTAIVSTLLRFRRVFEAAPDRSVLARSEHRDLARAAAAASMVLLANQDVLPLDATGLRRVAVIGALAARPNLGDGGSSDVHPPDAVTPLDGLRAALPDAVVDHSDADVTIAAGAGATIVVVGCTKEDEGEYIDPSIMGGLVHLFPPAPDRPAERRPAEPPAAATSGGGDGDGGGGGQREGFAPGGDRRSLRLSAEHERLVRDAAERSTGPVIVVLMGGSAIVAPWLDEVGAALHIWYAGMEGGSALADVLLGRREPGGRLPFALPVDEADLVHFDPDATSEVYGLLHGQWHLDRQGVEAHRPFGFGLGYTTFALSAPSLEEQVASVDVSNTGGRRGSTVVFAFGGVPGSVHDRPARRLIGFRRVEAAPGETVRVDIPLDLDLLDVRVDGGWTTEAGTYRIELGSSASDLPFALELERDGAGPSTAATTPEAGA